jgi:hypothetical protein
MAQICTPQIIKKQTLFVGHLAIRSEVNLSDNGDGNWGEKHNNKVTKQTRNNYNSLFQII